MFDVMTGKSLFWANFPLCKGYHLEFALGSKKFLFLHDYQMNSVVKIIDFPSFVDIKPNSEGQIDTKAIKILN